MEGNFMSQNKILTVLKHEFLLKVRSKGYIILTLLAPLLLASTAIIPIFISKMNSDEKKHIHIIDESGVVAPQLLLSKRVNKAG
jgi:ABC-2 type transport system permease protein